MDDDALPHNLTPGQLVAVRKVVKVAKITPVVAYKLLVSSSWDTVTALNVYYNVLEIKQRRANAVACESAAPEPPSDILRVTCMKATNLKRRGLYSIQVEVEGVKTQSGWAEGHENVHFRFCADFRRFSPRSFVRLTVWEKHSIRENRVIGEAFWNLCNINKDSTKYLGWIALDHKEKHVGELLADIQIHRRKSKTQSAEAAGKEEGQHKVKRSPPRKSKSKSPKSTSTESSAGSTASASVRRATTNDYFNAIESLPLREAQNLVSSSELSSEENDAAGVDYISSNSPPTRKSQHAPPHVKSRNATPTADHSRLAKKLGRSLNAPEPTVEKGEHLAATAVERHRAVSASSIAPTTSHCVANADGQSSDKIGYQQGVAHLNGEGPKIYADWLKDIEFGEGGSTPQDSKQKHDHYQSVAEDDRHHLGSSHIDDTQRFTPANFADDSEALWYDCFDQQDKLSTFNHIGAQTRAAHENIAGEHTAQRIHHRLINDAFSSEFFYSNSSDKHSTIGRNSDKRHSPDKGKATSSVSVAPNDVSLPNYFPSIRPMPEALGPPRDRHIRSSALPQSSDVTSPYASRNIIQNISVDHSPETLASHHAAVAPGVSSEHTASTRPRTIPPAAVDFPNLESLDNGVVANDLKVFYSTCADGRLIHQRSELLPHKSDESNVAVQHISAKGPDGQAESLTSQRPIFEKPDSIAMQPTSESRAFFFPQQHQYCKELPLKSSSVFNVSSKDEKDFPSSHTVYPPQFKSFSSNQLVSRETTISPPKESVAFSSRTAAKSKNYPAVSHSHISASPQKPQQGTFAAAPISQQQNKTYWSNEYLRVGKPGDINSQGSVSFVADQPCVNSSAAPQQRTGSQETLDWFSSATSPAVAANGAATEPPAKPEDEAARRERKKAAMEKYLSSNVIEFSLFDD